MRSTLRYCLPLLFLAMALPADAAQSPASLEASSLSGNYLAGRYASKLRDLDIAAEYFSQALRDDPNNSVLVERTFVLAFSAGDVKRAEELATAVLAVDPTHRLARTLLGIKEFNAGRYQKALEQFKN